MSIGGFFILVIVLGALVVVGGGVYAIVASFRRKQLHPEEDKLKGRLEGDSDRDDRPRPEHVRTGKSQRTRFVGSR
jgi:hypothetical protein